jgi:Ca-activated chloride channel family protein
VKIADLSISEGIIPLSYDLTGSSLGSNILTYDNGTREFFIATFSPSLSEIGTDGLPKDFVFLIDVSGSMSGYKIDQAKTALAFIIEQLHIDDRFAIVSFSDQISSASQSLIDRSNSETVDYVKGWVAVLSAGGSTDIHGALIAGLEYYKESERPSILVLLTDGKPTSGITNPLTIEEKFRGANIAGVSLFTLGFGSDVNFQFLGRIARQNSGDAFKIEVDVDAAEQITDFYESVSTPIIKDIKLTINSGVENNLIYPYFIPNLFDGSEIFLVGERVSGETIDLTITGESSAGELNYQIILSTPSSNEIKDSWVELIWAIAKIDDLINRIEYGDSSNETKELVLSMALFYGIVTPYTAIFIDTLDIDNTEESDNQMAAVTNTDAGKYRDLGAADYAGSSAAFDLISLIVAVLVLSSIKIMCSRRIRRK